MPYDPAQEPKLRVLPRGTARPGQWPSGGPPMVPHYETQENARVRRFHGWKHNPTLGAEYAEVDDKGKPTGRKVKQGAFVGSSEVIELPMRGEYLRHLRDGDLWPADEATASICGVKFDPTFGGEHVAPVTETSGSKVSVPPAKGSV